MPAIVSEELWKAANEEIDKRKKPVGNQERTARCFGVNPGKHVFSGKLVCGLCGAPFYRTTRKRKTIKSMNGNAKFIWNRGEKRRKSQAAVPISIWKRKSCFFFWKGPEEKKSCQIGKGRLRILSCSF
ncbi:MAG: zinc ribbon domain-containing protein [Ruminococcus sp.]